MASRSTRDARRRALGQNFLIDDRAIAAVIGTLHPPPGATVVDLGAGAGALTSRLAAAGARVIAVECDRDWARQLRAHATRWGEVEVVEGDALAIAFPRAPFFVVSNAPFNRGTAIVRRLLGEGHGLVRATLVLQLQAARRLAGKPRSGRFAATWAPWFELRVEHRIPAGAFRPIAAVEAAVLTLAPQPVPLLSPAAYGHYDAFLENLFRHRARPWPPASSVTTVTAGPTRRSGRRPFLRMPNLRAGTPGVRGPLQRDFFASVRLWRSALGHATSPPPKRARTA